jgi:hypothetical protein
VELWNKVSTVEDAEWTRRYHLLDIAKKAFGGSVEITLNDGTVSTDQIAVADAHPPASSTSTTSAPWTPLFVASQITGWTAHIMAQQASNSLIRPLSAYNGTEQCSI